MPFILFLQTSTVCTSQCLQSGWF